MKKTCLILTTLLLLSGCTISRGNIALKEPLAKKYFSNVKKCPEIGERVCRLRPSSELDYPSSPLPWDFWDQCTWNPDRYGNGGMEKKTPVKENIPYYVVGRRVDENENVTAEYFSSVADPIGNEKAVVFEVPVGSKCIIDEKIYLKRQEAKKKQLQKKREAAAKKAREEKEQAVAEARKLAADISKKINSSKAVQKLVTAAPRFLNTAVCPERGFQTELYFSLLRRGVSEQDALAAAGFSRFVPDYVVGFFPLKFMIAARDEEGSNRVFDFKASGKQLKITIRNTFTNDSDEYVFTETDGILVLKQYNGILAENNSAFCNG